MSEHRAVSGTRTGLLTCSGSLAGPRALAVSLGAEVEGDLDGCLAAFARGVPIAVHNPGGYAVDRCVRAGPVGRVEDASWNVVISDLSGDTGNERTVRLVPRGLVVGIGASSGVATDTASAALSGLGRLLGPSPRAVRAVATVDRRACEPGLRTALREYFRDRGVDSAPPLLGYASEVLSCVTVASPSGSVRSALGTASVAEAAALRAASELGDARPHLVLPKTVVSGMTLAVARIPAPGPC
ncbi:cobalamin biosynthesis protein [Actinopolyspora halophila]|uniref:cobalamin biosynthesis protein n=1 Tax=Actinopolyspora halophila TaxID=1850 RepID=UPI00036C95D6|nr:cobalamin biosynthesis protein [Actinopolyspora halophila]